MYGGGYYPPGTPGPHGLEIEMKCTNPDCDLYDEVVEVGAYWELGGTFLDNEDDELCSKCGKERIDV